MSEIQRYRPKLLEDIKINKKADPQGWIVIALTLIIVVIFFTWLIVTISKDTNPDDVVQRCNPGLCAFDVFTGRKRCPAPGQEQGVRIAPGAEFCTSPDYCQQEPYVCAVQPDQSWRCDGVCGQGNSQCRCISRNEI